MMRAAAVARLVVITTAFAAATVILASAASVPFDVDIDTSAVKRAIDLGRSPAADSSRRFHDRYVVLLGEPPLDRLEIVTEFRRVVLATENRVRFADTTWGPEQAEAMLRPWRERVSLVLHVTFAPNNTYRSMPRFDVVLYEKPFSAAPGSATSRQAKRIEPIDLVETPRYVSGQPAPPGTPILAGTVEATFSARGLDRTGTYLAAILLADRELRRVELDFSRIE